MKWLKKTMMKTPNKEKKMNKKIVCSALVAAFAFAGCSIKAPEPKNAFKGEQMTINNRLLDRQYHFVPKDSYLENLNYSYELWARKQGGYMLPNELVVKTFMLAHNSNKIVLLGKEPLLSEYKAYFIKNGVMADIYIQPLDNADGIFDTQVQMLFFNKRVESN